jgi:hypothetical protein
VTDIGDSRELVAQDDIYASNGMKLVARGAHVNRHHFELLTQHRLKIPLDHSLSLAAPVSPAQLALEAAQMLEHDPLLAQIAASSGDALAVKHALAQLPLSAALCFRLSVMRAQRERLYSHSLRIALLAHAIALRLALAPHECGNLLLAALCHDIGELHTDPAILAPGHRMSSQERRFVYVHPVTGFVLLQQLSSATCAASAQAVLHHHERADGSGYPYGLTGEQIHPLGRLLAVAEVAEGLLRRHELERLDVLLKLNHGRFDPAVVGALRDLLRASPLRGSVKAARQECLAASLARLSDVLQKWHEFARQLKRDSAEQESDMLSLGFLFERMDSLHSLVRQAGCDPDDMATVLEQVEEDDGAIRELSSLAGELSWLMTDLANEIERRTPGLAHAHRPALERWSAVLNAA